MYLSLELLIEISKINIYSYKAMLAIPDVARFWSGKKRQKQIKKIISFKQTICDIDEFVNRRTRYYKNGKLDSSKGPSIILECGLPNGYVYNRTEEWYKNNELHRNNGPALCYCSLLNNRCTIKEQYYNRGKRYELSSKDKRLKWYFYNEYCVDMNGNINIKRSSSSDLSTFIKIATPDIDIIRYKR